MNKQLTAEEILRKHYDKAILEYPDENWQDFDNTGIEIKLVLAAMEEYRLSQPVQGMKGWVKASERLPEPYRQQYIKNGANWDLGHYDPTKNDFCCLGGWTGKRLDLIQWLDQSLLPLKEDEWVELDKELPEKGEEVLATNMLEPEPWVVIAIRKKEHWYNSWDITQRQQSIPIFPTHWKRIKLPQPPTKK